MLRHILMACLAVALSASGAAPVVTGLDLLDADTGGLIAPLQNNDTLDLNVLGQRAFRIRANLSGSGSVHFQVSGIEYAVNGAPYIMGADWLPAPGTYTITATPWEGADATGEQGTEWSITVAVVDALEHRMRPVRIQSTVPHAAVQLRMLRHAFPFGSMTKETSSFGISQTDSPDEITYRETFHSNFNSSVAGNAMKWYTQQPDWWNQSPHNTGYSTPGNYRYDQADDWLDYHESVGIPVRGHTLFWGAGGGGPDPLNQMKDPNWVEALGTNALYWMEQRVSGIVSRYAGRIDEWDFNNELWHGDWYRNTFGSTITKQMADWAVAANPDIKLWFNEYGMLNNSNNAAAFLAHLQTLQGEGVQIDGVGVQGHFGSAPNTATVKASLDILDELGLPIKVTEFDCGSTNMTETQMADGLETVYRTAFEHQAVEGIIMWGFWESNHWKPERALWKADWTPTEQAHRYRELVYDEWWSDADLLVDQNGQLPFNLFAGDFEITINGKTFTNSIAAGSGTLNFAYDGTNLMMHVPPAVELTAPANGTSFVSGQPIELTADASSGTASVAKVEFYADNQLLKTDAVAPYTAVWYDASAGSYALTAVATDTFGFSNQSAPVHISVASGNGNLVDNPGFEFGTTNWSGHGGHSIGTMSAPVYSGSSAGRAFDRNNTYDGLSQTLTDELIVGRSYVFACQARLSESNDTGRITVKTSYLTNSPTYQNVASALLDDTGWARVQGEYTFNPDPLHTVTEVRFYIAGVQPPVEIFVDDMFCAETTLATIDYDMDGMPDQWEETHFGSINAANGGAFEDWDSDGIGNRDEYRSGTVPADANSRLAIISLQLDAARMDIGWHSVSGKTYRIMTSTNLLSNDWKLEAEGLPALGTESSASLGTDASVQFIKIELDE
ncbi:endo-1,4-beta-xylanase [Pontiellaceae bacterium B12227]|nr:endo-1,4-beta-xylanase [Pontiellaceae bacterium B12227]